MLKKLKEQARALGEKLAADEARLKEGRAEIQAFLVKAAEDGSLGTKASTDALEELSKPIDALAEEVEETRRGWGAVMSQIGEAAPAGSTSPFNPSAIGGNTAAIADSWGDALATSQVYKDLVASGRLNSEKARIGNTDGVAVTHGWKDVKALITSANYPLIPQRDDSVAQRLPMETVTILDLISIGSTTTEIVEWVVQTLRDDKSGSKGEGVAFSESAYDWDVETAQVHEVGHYAKTTKRALKDEGQLRTLTDQDMVDGLRAKIQRLIISGDAVGEDFLGLLNTDGIGGVEFDASKGDVYLADTVHRAMTTIRIATAGAVEPTAIGIHPLDWEAHVLAKDKNDNYINGGPNSPAPATMWGLKPVVHVCFPQGNPLVGDYKKAKLWIWSDVALSFTDSNEDDFLTRKVAVMAAFGAAFGVPQPAAFCEVVTKGGDSSLLDNGAS
jgi:HK97 family phage major capsid protein